MLPKQQKNTNNQLPSCGPDGPSRKRQFGHDVWILAQRATGNILPRFRLAVFLKYLKTVRKEFAWLDDSIVWLDDSIVWSSSSAEQRRPISSIKFYVLQKIRPMEAQPIRFQNSPIEAIPCKWWKYVITWILNLLDWTHKEDRVVASRKGGTKATPWD